MTVQTTSRRRRVVAAAGVVALSIAGLLGGTAAQAAPSFGDIDGDATGSITVHKHENQGGTAVTGDPAGGSTLPNPIAGAGFTAYTLTGIDLTTNQGWEDVNDAVVSDCDATLNGTSIKGASAGTGTTDADGELTFSGLDVGAYLVCETSVPANVDTPAQPFIVTIPFPDNQNGAPSNSNGWLYDVHVYPKNTLKSELTKTVDKQTKFGLGETVSFPISASVPRIPAENYFTEFGIVDDMSDAFTDVKVVSVQVDGTDVDSSYYEKTADGVNPVKVWFNADGLEWLKTQGGKKVVVTVSGTVTKVGAIENVANARISHEPGTPTNPPEEPEPCNPSDPDDPCIVTPPVYTNWGDAKLLKVDAANGTSTLQGAKFEVYAADNPYAADCSTTQPTGSAISVNGSTEFTSDANGVVNIAGLFVSDSVNPPQNASERCYWVKETVAPAGYVLPSDPNFSITVKTGTTTGVDVTVENEKTTVPGLPLTGAQGQIMLIAGGLVLLALGVTLYTVRRRQQHASR